MAKKKNAAPATRVEAIVHRPVRLSRDGLPVDAKDWTRTDWQDLHEAMERAKRAIAKRHSEDVG